MSVSTLVLCSGGMDSIVCARKAEINAESVSLLHINYGQLTVGAEIEAIKACGRYFSWAEPILLKIDAMGGFGSGSLVTASPCETSFFPHRNLMLISLASVVASSILAEKVVVGTIDAANPEFADCGSPFLDTLKRVLALDDPSLVLEAPLALMSKQDVGAVAAELGVPLDLTFSCNVGPRSHCQKCRSCADRAKALNAYHLRKQIIL